jgi:hypothetical protein
MWDKIKSGTYNVPGGMTMSESKEMLIKINILAADIIKQIVSDKATFQEQYVKNAVENLSRSVLDLTSIQLGNKNDIETTLQATLSKMKISYNLVLQAVEESCP